MPRLLLVFALVSVLTTAADLLLRRRQASIVARHRDAVPAAFVDSVSLAEHQRAADYETARLRLGAAATLFGLLVSLGWAFVGYDALYGGVAGVVRPGLGRSLSFLVAVGAVSWGLQLPWSVMRTFGVEQRFGFNRTRPGGFVTDKLKGAGLSLAVGVPVVATVLWLMRQPGQWWVWAWLGLMALMLLAIHAYPRWVAPLFNRFTPLEGALRARIESLLRRCGFQSSGLFVMDASRGPRMATRISPGWAGTSASFCSTR